MAYEIKIDYDKAIRLYNEKHPDKKMTKEGLFRIMTNHLDRATVKNYKDGKVPKGFHVLHEVAEICECDENDIKTVKKI